MVAVTLMNRLAKGDLFFNNVEVQRISNITYTNRNISNSVKGFRSLDLETS